MVGALRLRPERARTIMLTREADRLKEPLASEHAMVTYAEELVLGDLDRTGSIALLRDRGLGDRGEHELGRLHERTRGHPKGLELCAGLLVGGMAIEELEEMPLFRGSGDEDTSLKRILRETEKRLSRDELRLLQRCSVFDEPFDARAVAAVYRRDEWVEVADKLERRFLLSRRNGRYDLHPLVREYFYDGLKDEVVFVHGLAGHYYLGEANDAGDKAQRLTLNLKAHRHFELAKDNRQLIDLFWPVFNGLNLAGRGEEAARVCELAHDACRALKDREAEADSLGALALVRAHQGRVGEAIGLNKRALHIAGEIGDRRGQGNHLGNLGLAYAALGEVERAIEHHEQALEISREIGDRRGQGNHLGNLGSAYADLGEVEKAIGYYQQALEISREIGDRPGEGSRLHNLGDELVKAGQNERALACLLSAVEVGRAIDDPRMSGREARIEELKQKLGEEEFARLLESVEPNKATIVEDMLQSRTQRDDTGTSAGKRDGR